MAQNTITNMMLVTGACVTAGSALPTIVGGKGELPTVRTLIGLGVTFFVLSTADDYIPQVARPLAVAVGGTAFSMYGIPVLVKLLQNK
jgi:hypothetical protein